MEIEVLERAANGGGQLLRAEVAPVDDRTDMVSALVLTFDLGRIAISAEPETSTLRAYPQGPQDAAPRGLRDASEEEPWWRVLGNPIARTWLADLEAGRAICVQFRADEQNPRILTLQARNGNVAIRLEPSA